MTDLPTFDQTIKQLEKKIESQDFFTQKTIFDKSKLPLNKEYQRAKLLYYDKTVFTQPD
jgi:hypothetical protein